ncbi:hypothetical protein PRUPE_8G258900 [Prunus persica]|uniref:Uncharacterized protein n=1 Tax=Prunus persica TaxID=3760 RepID=A0A251N3F9_PRUPE|nr:hypothetical protein PRUPE_8G258900 [Prunus persica]
MRGSKRKHVVTRKQQNVDNQQTLQQPNPHSTTLSFKCKQTMSSPTSIDRCKENPNPDNYLFSFGCLI